MRTTLMAFAILLGLGTALPIVAHAAPNNAANDTTYRAEAGGGGR